MRYYIANRSIIAIAVRLYGERHHVWGINRGRTPEVVNYGRMSDLEVRRFVENTCAGTVRVEV